MNRMMMIAAMACGAGAACGQTWTISWSTIDTGGSLSAASGMYRVSGSIGQHDASGRLFVRGLAVDPGFWPGANPPCAADFNNDGFVDFFDFDDFVACFEGGACPPGKSADFNGDGFADFFDYDDFVAAFESGC